MSIQKLIGSIRFFKLIRQDFSLNAERKKPRICLNLDPYIILKKKTNQNFPFDGQIGYRSSCMDFLTTKIFRFLVILHDAAGPVESTTQGSGFCNFAPRFPRSCFLGHVNGLFFYFYIKVLVNGRIPCSVVSHLNQKCQSKKRSNIYLCPSDMECTGNNRAKELVVFKSEKIDVIFFFTKKLKATSQSALCRKHIHGII